MILSVSRRTDIPAFYSEWFFNRLKAGFVDVRNPMNIHQVSRIKLSPDVIDCIVFWSKNPKPMLERLDELEKYRYYFQFTINPYDKGIEYDVPRKAGIIETFRALSKRIGSRRVIWRYDPILFSDEIDMDYHIKYFEEIASRLEGYVRTCVISFIDLYKKTERNIMNTTIREPNELEMHEVARRIVDIARRYGITVKSCAERIDLSEEGIEHGQCIDQMLISDIIGCPLLAKKDKCQRKECGCVESIDIGQYNTCTHNCIYCYANFQKNMVVKNSCLHNPRSALLIGELTPEHIVKERKMVSMKDNRLLFS